MAGMNTQIPTVLSAEELMDKAFRRANKISKTGSDALDTKKKTTLARITASGDIVETTLVGYIQKFPRMEKNDDFFPQLVDLVIGIDQYKKSLGALNWAAGQVERLRNGALREVRRYKDPARIDAVRKSFYGRLGSYLNQISKDLLFLQDAKNKFRELPSIDPKVPTAVIAGFPNVGKSSLVTYISSAAPEVAPYPFTTKGITIGHIADDWRKFQIVDTPGLLDRDFEDRNDIEKQAVLALRYLTDVMVFILDPSETCGYDMGKQTRLLENIRSNFEDVPILVVESKCDVMRTEGETRRISSVSGEGMAELKEELVKMLREIFRQKALQTPLEEVE
ncbi:small GTP-binding protein domain protein [Thermoplasmatales archaeon BRNA1]|nr:small GTP-binding protein domain protein [Thermoplasmatales archaeon BRNA1]